MLDVQRLHTGGFKGEASKHGALERTVHCEVVSRAGGLAFRETFPAGTVFLLYMTCLASLLWTNTAERKLSMSDSVKYPINISNYTINGIQYMVLSAQFVRWWEF